MSFWFRVEALSRQIVFSVAALATIFFSAPAVDAQTVAWTGAAAPDANWSTAHNWLSDSGPTDGASVAFDTNSVSNLATINDLSNLNLLNIQVAAGVGGAISIGGKGFTINSGIDMTAATQALTIALDPGEVITLAPSTPENFTVKAPQTLTISSPIVGDATTSITLVTPGGTGSSHGTVQLLAGSPNFAGNLTIGGPNMIVNIGADDSFGAGTITCSSFNSAPLLQSSGGTRTIANNWNWTSGFGIGGTSDWVLNGNIKFTGDVAGQTNRTLNNTVAQTVTVNGTITVGDPDITPTVHNRSFTINSVVGGNVIINGPINDPTSATNTDVGSFVKANPGPASLTNTTSTYSGTTAIQNGILEIASLANKGQPSSLGTGASSLTNADKIAIGNGSSTGTLRYTGSANISTDRPLTLAGTTGGATLDSSGTGTMSFTSPTFGTTGSGTKTFTLTGTNTGPNTIAGVITNNSGANTTAVSKTNNGTWVLTGASTYSGGTQINGGTLRINNTSGSGTGLGQVTVNNGGTLAGTGSASGATTVNSGGTLSPGTPETNNGIGTLTIANTLTLSGGTVLNFDLGGSGHDLISGITNLSLPASGTVTVNLANVGGLAAGAPFPIIDYSGSLSGAFSTLTLTNQPAGFTYALINDTSNTSIDLQVSATGLPGDFNSDGTVDAGDYLLWRKNNNTSNPLPNDNGLGVPITAAHYNLWRANFGRPPGSGSGLSASAVPEPASCLLWLAGLSVVGGLRRRSNR